MQPFLPHAAPGKSRPSLGHDPYQVTVAPIKLQGYDIPISRVVDAIQRSNNDVGGRLVEMGETEFMVRGRGYVKGIEDLNNVPLGVDQRGIPILLRNVASVRIGPELRRGIADYNGDGEVVGGFLETFGNILVLQNR